MVNKTSARARVGWAVALVGALLTALAWSLASPPGSAPDDNFHVATIWCTSVWNEGRCQYDGPAEGAYGQAYYLAPAEATFIGLDNGLGAKPPCYVNDMAHGGECPPAPAVQRVSVNAGLYPPLFYSYAGLFAADSQDRTVLQVRLGVALSVIALIAAAYAATRRWLRPALLVSLAVGLVPLGLSLIPSTNPSAWAIPAVGVAWAVGVSCMLAPGTRQRVFAGIVWLVAALMACGSRSDAAAYLLLITLLTVALLWTRSQLASRIFALVVLLGSGWTVLTSGQTSNVTSGFLEETGGRTFPSLVLQAIRGIPALWVGGTGAPGGPTNVMTAQLGWFDTPVPPVTWVGLLMVIGALMFAGLGWLPWRKAVALAGLGGVGALLPFYVLVSNKAIPGELLQPRYLLPLMLAIFGISLARSAAVPLRLTRVQVTIVIVIVAIAQSAALQLYMRRFLTGIDENEFSLAQPDEWWWVTSVSPDLVWLLGTAGWAMVVTVALLHLRDRRSQAADQQRDPAPQSV